MSGSGGYYKYRWKYWLTYNCPNWVWVNNAPCAHCLADGRDGEERADLDMHSELSGRYVDGDERGLVVQLQISQEVLYLDLSRANGFMRGAALNHQI